MFASSEVLPDLEYSVTCLIWVLIPPVLLTGHMTLSGTWIFLGLTLLFFNVKTVFATWFTSFMFVLGLQTGLSSEECWLCTTLEFCFQHPQQVGCGDQGNCRRVSSPVTRYFTTNINCIYEPVSQKCPDTLNTWSVCGTKLKKYLSCTATVLSAQTEPLELLNYSVTLAHVYVCVCTCAPLPQVIISFCVCCCSYKVVVWFSVWILGQLWEEAEHGFILLSCKRNWQIIWKSS